MYFDNYDKKLCNGCGVCSFRCPRKAITMKVDSEGFLYPRVDKNKCINCGLCKRICPNHVYPKNKNIKSYIAINRDKKVLSNSSSGGVFYLIAKYVLDNNGVVFGAAYDNNLVVTHIFVERKCDLIKLQGSKYVQSKLGDSYKNVEKFLKNGRYVLFSGTPCQCQGLRTYLGKEYDKLITCEIICHAVVSPKVFGYYKKNLELRKGIKIKNILFRSKKTGWKNQNPVILYANGEEEEEKVYFYKGFVQELLNRPCCHNCYFCTSNRLSDFTMGDMWGIKKIDKSINDDDTGISLFCVNTQKGNKILKSIKENLYLKKVDTELAFSYNHYKNVLMNKNRNKFYEGINDGSINETNVIKYIKKYGNKPLYKKILNRIKYYMSGNKKIYLFIKRLFDILFSIIGIILLIIVSIIVKLIFIFNKDYNTIFYKQKRIGKNGKVFNIYKFRTMVIDADNKLKELCKNKKYKDEWERYQKLSDDPRILKVGKFMRRTSLDELPQVINILKNDMSLVGPRPLVKGELDKHHGNHKVYESIKPGITGWWVVNKKKNTNYKTRLELEYYYINNCNLLMDIKCIFKTIIIIIGGFIRKERRKK